ncbi:hypothetical protein Csa_006892 [Cucumis sativus]|nr:hypothetical protein Csa_006892 [Cucumis sativus]
MEPNSDPPPFWPPSPPIHRRRSYSPPFISLPVLIILLPTLALILLFFAIRPLLSLINQVYKPSSVKKSWDSFNVFLVLFAIICGIFSRRNDDVPTTADGDTRGSDQMTVVDTGGVKVNGDSESSQQWFGFSERRFSDPTGRAPVTTRLRRNSSYPDLRQESLWGNGDDSNNQFRFFDDFEINKFRSRSFVYRTRGNEREESPAIPVDSFVVNSSPAPEKMKSQSPNPPPPPPPPLPVTQRKPRRTYQNIQKKEEIPENKAEFTPPPPPPLPPRTVIPPSPVRVRLEEKFGKSVRKKTNVKKEIAMALASLREKSLTPTIPPPPPPPPSFKTTTDVKSTVGSDTVGSRSSETSRCGSPDPENVNTSASGGAGVGSVFCPSPDVNVKAANFIARLRGEWRLEKMNSVREKERLGQGPNYEITTGLGPNRLILGGLDMTLISRGDEVQARELLIKSELIPTSEHTLENRDGNDPTCSRAHCENTDQMKLAGLKSVENAHEESVWAATWVPATDTRPSLLLTGSLDETVKLWKSDELDLERTNTGHCLGVVSVAAHPSGFIAASASLDSFVRVFEVDSNSTIATLEAPPSEVWQMRFNPEGTMLAVAGGGSASIKLWDTNTWKLAATLSIPRPEGPKPTDKTASKKFVLSVAWSIDGRRLACGSMDGTISVFDVARAKFLHHLEGHFMPVRSLVYSPVEPRLLFSASDDAHVHMYDAEGKTLIGAMSGHSSWVLSVDASPDGAAVATGSSDRTVRLWDLNMRTAVQTMTNHSDQVWGVAFRPPGGVGVRSGRLASVSDDKSISLYDYS